MIISHKHKFIFIKPQKTAGTSVELMLSRICGPEDVITPLGFDPDPKVREKNQAKPPQNYCRPKPLKHWQLNELYRYVTKGRKPNLNYWEHLSADKIRENVGNDIWDAYTKISVVRNPWDHAVSMFEWMSKFNFEGVKSDEFDEFVKYKYKHMWPFYSINGVYSIDRMIRFEYLDEDMDTLIKSYENHETLSLPKTKNGIRTKKSFKSYFDSNTYQIIEEMNLNIIEKFKYKF